MCGGGGGGGPAQKISSKKALMLGPRRIAELNRVHFATEDVAIFEGSRMSISIALAQI